MGIGDYIKETKLIKQNFSFLFEQGFSIIHAEPARHFNNWLLDLASPSLRIQFSEDRTELNVLVGPKSARTGWYEVNLWQLQLLVFHLTKDFNSAPRWFLTKNMEKAAKILHSNFTQIFDLFQNNDYPTLVIELKKSRNILRKHWDPEIPWKEDK